MVAVFSGKSVDRAPVEQYLREVNIPSAVAGTKQEAQRMGGLRRNYLSGLADCRQKMWYLATEILGKGAAVPYERCVKASTARAPEPSQPEAKRERVAGLLGRAGFALPDRDGLLQSVDAWRRERTVSLGSVRASGAAVIAYFDQLSAMHLLP